MRYIRRKGWETPEFQATSEDVFLNRRRLLIGAGALAASGASGMSSSVVAADEEPYASDLYPSERNDAYVAGRALTDESYASTYNNFYEFGSHKSISRAAQALRIRPWQVRIDGLVEKPRTVDVEELIRSGGLEERVYRHRCVEAWAMTVPWTGFSFASLVRKAAPLSSAKYIRMETFLDPNVASGQRQSWYPWPYVEGVTIDEAVNDLAFLVTGVYGKPLAKQYGAPLRLALPWKYGFKSIKSIVRFEFVESRPVSFWERVQGGEYGFWANVNPEVSHPRWSQATERLLGSDERVPTVLYNGYGEFVADLYSDVPSSENLFL